MKVKCTILTVAAVFLVLAMHSETEAVDTKKIDICCRKDVLDSGDLQTIDKFVGEAVGELVRTRDFTSIAKIRTVILSRSSSSKESAVAQYDEQFFESAYKYISEGFKTVETLTPQERRLKATLNLLILVDGLADVRLADLAVGMLKDENAVIRYWAVHCVTNAGIIRQLNSGERANPGLGRRIAEQLKGLVANSGPEILALMAEFAAEVDIPQGEDLLLQIADTRISKYADWSVEYELLDATILKLLYNKMLSAGRSKAAIGRRFGQLYSYVMQRYIKGRDFLGATEKHQLASVLTEIEKSCISELLDMPQSVIKRAIERGNYMSLLQEHSRLLGDETHPGELPLKLNFDYGQESGGKKRMSPLVLPEPPKTEASA